MTITKPAIKWIGAHPGNYRARVVGVAPECIVLHVAQGSIGAVDGWFNTFPHIVNGVDVGPASTHFCVSQTGEIHQYVSLEDTAYAHGIVEAGYTAQLIDENAGISPNDFAVGIEHAGKLGDAVTDAQFDASTRLSAWLWHDIILPGLATGLVLDRDHILKHGDISPKSRANCPGWSEAYIASYIARVKELLTVPIPDPRDERIRELVNGLTLSASSFDTEALAAQNAANRLRAMAVGARDAIKKFGG